MAEPLPFPIDVPSEEVVANEHKSMLCSVSRQEEKDGSLTKFIEQQCQNLQASLERKFDISLMAAVNYFLQCQEEKEQGRKLPSTPEVPQMSASPLISGGFNSTAQPDGLHQAGNELPLWPCPQNEGSLTALPYSSIVFLLQSAELLEEHECTEEATDDKLVTGTSNVAVMRHAHWQLQQLDKTDEVYGWHSVAYERKKNLKAKSHKLMSLFGFGHLMPAKSPENALVTFVRSTFFHGVVAATIVLNTAFGTIQADISIRNHLEESPGKLSAWWDILDESFTIFFCVELAFRLAAFRLWFFVAPEVWTWNMFDSFLVVSSLAADHLSQVDVFRFVRMFRVVRVARVLRLLENFTELRKLLFAVIGCLHSLFWAAAFLAVTMFIFSLFILQGLKAEMSDEQVSPELLEAVRKNFNGLGGCFKTLYVVVAGDEWLDPHEPLSQLGITYSAIMPIFVLFVNIGVMNVVIGVFAEAASRCKDRDLVAQDQIGDVEDFITAMLKLFKDYAPKDEGRLGWDNFKTFFCREDVQAYFASHGLDASHAHLIYDLCDKDQDNTVDIREFVLGLLRLKGEARALDQRVLAHAIDAVTQDVNEMWQELRLVVNWTRPRTGNHAQVSDATNEEASPEANARQAKAFNSILQSDADIVCLQEVEADQDQDPLKRRL